MATIQRSYEQIADFDQRARGYLARRDATFAGEWRQKNPESTQTPPSPPPNKFTYAINRMLKRSQSILSQYREKIEDINIQFCSEDKDGNVATDERGQFKFKRDELLKRNHAQRELFKTKIDIEVYIATEVPKDLSDDDKEVLTGFVIPEESEAETDGASPPARRSPKKESARV